MANKQRLFVDMDGTLAVFTPVDELETLYEKGYFLNQVPHENVVAAVREIITAYPDIEVNILSAVLTDSKYALQEKNQWLNRYLPEIDNSHRIFVPCGSDKKEGITGGLRENDFLLDDYTYNLNEWQPPARGIKLLNAINHTRGSWKYDRIRYDRAPKDLANGIVAVMRDGQRIFDEKTKNIESEDYKIMANENQTGLPPVSADLAEKNSEVLLNPKQMPVSEIATLDFVRNPDRQGMGGITRGSNMFEALLLHTREADTTELYKAYDEAWTTANLIDDFAPKIAILQLREGAENRNRRFTGLDSLEEPPRGENYEIIYVRRLDAPTETESERLDLGETLYTEFNAPTLRPQNYYGHSLSVGDVVVIANDFNEQHAYYLDTVGLTKLPNDFLTHQLSAKIRNNLDIRQEELLLERITRFEAANIISIGDKQTSDRNFQITGNYLHIFEMADRRGAIMDMDVLGFEPTEVEGFSDDFLMWRNKSNHDKTFGIDGWEAVRDIAANIKTLQGKYSIQELRDMENHEFSGEQIAEADSVAIEKAIEAYPQRVSLDVYRRQVQVIYEYEVANAIPENERMTGLQEETGISYSKPFYKINDPSVMQRAENERHIGISEAAINKRYAEIYAENKRQKINEKSDNIHVEKHTGTWYVIDHEVIDKKSLFLVESEQYGDEAASLIIDEQGNLVLEDVYNGFEDYRDAFPSVETQQLMERMNLEETLIKQWQTEQGIFLPESEWGIIHDLTNDVDGVKDILTLEEMIYQVLENYTEKQRAERIENVAQDNERPELITGDIMEYEGKQWRVKSNDGFMLTAEPIDKSGTQTGLSWIGNITENEYTLLERNGQAIEQPNVKTVTDPHLARIADILKINAEYPFNALATELAAREGQKIEIAINQNFRSYTNDELREAVEYQNNYVPIPFTYYEEDLAIDGTADNLFIEARNGYIDNPDALHRIAEILSQEGKNEKAELVGYMEEREREDTKGYSYSVAQMKLDFMDGQYTGVEDAALENGLSLSVLYEKSNDTVLVHLSRDDGSVRSEGTNTIPFDTFKGMSRVDFDIFVNETFAYGMEEQEQEIDTQERLFTLDGHNCREVDAWSDNTATFTLGQDVEDNSFYYAGVVTFENAQLTVYEFDHLPTREDVESRFADDVAMREIDRREAEYGADGNRVFNHGDNEKAQHEPTSFLEVPIDEELSPKDQLKQRLENGVRQVLDSENFKNWLSTGGKLFYNNYSFRNAMLVWLQKPEASYVMGYEKWKEFGRNVAQGSQGAKIFIPLMASEKYKGGMFRSIKSNLFDQLTKNPTATEASYRLGTSNFEFTMNRANHLVGFKVNGKEQQIFGSDEEARRFIDRAIIGKVPTGFTVGTVFDAKDVIVPEYLWLKSGFAKTEIAPDEKGNPVKNRRGETRIVNTAERQARFQTDLDTKIVAKDPVKMQTLFEACCAASERKGVPVTLSEQGEDSVLDGDTKGYFSRETSSIVLDNSLEITEKCAVLFHEMGHADLHKNLEALAKSMGEEKITRTMKEIQAEAVAFATASTFGIKTGTSSFEYLAVYTKGFEMQDFQKSLDVIYKETRALTNDIQAELDMRGFNLDLSEKPKGIFSTETLKTLSTKYMDFATERGNTMQAALNELPSLVKQSANNNALIDVLKYQKLNLDAQSADLSIMFTAVESLNTADTREKQDEAVSTLDSAVRRIEGNSKAFEGLSERFVVITERARGGLKVDFEQDPMKTLIAMKKDFPALASLSDTQLQYAVTSKVVSRDFTKMLRDNPQGFVDRLTERAALLGKAASKNGTFVEINLCEQWTDEPFLKNGTLCSPKIADKIITACEAQMRGFKEEAAKRGEYFPYAKCDMTIFTPSQDGRLLSYNTRVDIGDGEQVSLKDHLEQMWRRGADKKEMLENFTEALTERADKRKMILQDLSNAPQGTEAAEKDVSKEGNMSREDWGEVIQEARDSAAREQKEPTQGKTQSKSEQDRVK